MAKGKKLAPHVTAADLRRLLRERCVAPAWAIFEEVHNGTGSRSERRADAVAMSLYPSRGLEIHGFEIKVQRRDWVKERDLPEKADAIGKYCDRWWVVVSDDSIVRPGELPPAWGLLVARGGKLVQAIEAPLNRSVSALDRPFLAAMLRRAHETFKDSVPKTDVQTEIYAGIQRLRKSDADHNPAAKELGRLQLAVKEFEEASGIKIETYAAGDVGREFAAFRLANGFLKQCKNRLENAQRQAKEMIDAAARGIAELDASHPESNG